MSSIEDFAEITKRDETLAAHTWLKVGGPAQYLIEPRTDEELAAVVQCCHESELPVRVLGGGSNLLIRDEGIEGVVIRFKGDLISRCDIEGEVVRASGGLPLSALISKSVQAGLSGLEVLVGIPGTVGGAIHGNAGGRSGDIGQMVQKVEVLTGAGERFVREEDELSFAYRQSSVNELAILGAEFHLKAGNADEITQRMRKLWIMRKASQPFSYQSAGCIFKNPRGMSAASLIDQAGLKGTRVGNAEISDQHANFVVTYPEASSNDVLRLIDLARTKVQEQFGVDLELEIQVW